MNIEFKISPPRHRLGQPTFELTQQERITNPYGLDFHIPAGYKWDGASSPLFRQAMLMPSLPHDYIYDGNVPAISRKEADQIFIYYCKRYKVPTWLRFICYWSLRIFGRYNWCGPKDQK